MMHTTFYEHKAGIGHSCGPHFLRLHLPENKTLHSLQSFFVLGIKQWLTMSTIHAILPLPCPPPTTAIPSLRLCLRASQERKTHTCRLACFKERTSHWAPPQGTSCNPQPPGWYAPYTNLVASGLHRKQQRTCRELRKNRFDLACGVGELWQHLPASLTIGPANAPPCMLSHRAPSLHMRAPSLHMREDHRQWPSTHSTSTSTIAQRSTLLQQDEGAEVDAMYAPFPLSGALIGVRLPTIV